jgi:signal transduction histidine kinase
VQDFDPAPDFAAIFGLSAPEGHMGEHREEQDALAIELDRVTDGFMAFDRDWRFTHANSRAAAFFQRTPAALVGEHLLTIAPEIVGTKFYEHGQRALREQTPQVYEEYFEPRWYEGRIYPARDGISVFFNDITDRVSADTERAEMVERLHLAQRLEGLGRLVGGVAHDFNTMLAIILAQAELVCDAVEDRPAVHADATQIRETAERASELVRRLLLFARRDPGHVRAVDLNDVLAKAEPLLRRTLPERIELVLAPTRQACVVTADPEQLEQILINLVVNARDAMRDGGRLTLTTECVEVDDAASVHLDDLPPGGYGALTVIDTGEGMPPEVLDRAFEPFFTTRMHGTGLGLAVVYGISKESGGHVALYAEPGRGTTARVRLPLAGRPADVPAASPQALPEGRGELVLVVEDSAPLRQLTRRVLEDAGYRVAEAESGSEALADGPPDLLLTDVVMPGMSGRELAEAIWARAPGLPVVLMSGYTDDVVVRDGLPGARFLEKPFTRAQLLCCVRAALDG